MGKVFETMPDAAARAEVSERVRFIRRTYAHLAAAIFAFVGLEYVVLQLPFAQAMTAKMLSSRYAWLVVLGLFMAAGWVADKWARSSESKGMQYLGLGLYVLAEVIIFVPLLYIASTFPKFEGVIPTAALLTLTLFTGLTLTVFITKKDFSFLRGALMLAGFAALGIIVGGILFGFSLGLWFAVAMTVLAAGYTLYYTSNVLRYYRTDQHVAASLTLFSAIALMFYYIVIIVMRMRD